ncbi:beta-ketoacyl-ACP synthase II [Pandoraea vervacti]|uniref:Beta-ketoacyl-ACP synthase II n=1 Tax=Pandoraea vervacti TaxID=656178 RepID=A0ABN4FT06_9BURK|nr:beta-ketoacyl-ACP synthase [Pandoraea vervacti]AJP57751.1 beta-ketoacyl-ACP synthase II [Pandoraea vervacti]
MNRVVVTGFGGITALGSRWEDIETALRAGQNAVRRMPEWDYFEMLNGRLACPVEDFAPPPHWPRKQLRSMGRVAQLSLRATEHALASAGLDIHTCAPEDIGVAYGSSSGSIAPIHAFGVMVDTGSMAGVTSTSYIQMMPHTTAVNIGVHFGLQGRIIPTSSACTSGSQAIGYAYEAIRFGRVKAMLAGGAEELSGPGSAVFDTLYATSTRNDEPKLTPRPFDVARDGLVVGEGAATLVMESLEHAKARGATILAEIVGFGCTSDGNHVTQPTSATMARAMELALADANLRPDDISYISAHGTATDRGDVAESEATFGLFGSNVPISAMKSYLGHTLGACGAIEAWWAIEMMRRNWFAGTLNLESPDPACAALDHIAGAQGRALEARRIMSNNFAFGGINTSLIFEQFVD